MRIVSRPRNLNGQAPGIAGLRTSYVHNNDILIDAGTAFAMMITASFNFKRAAQHKNAENIAFISGDDGWCRRTAKTGSGIWPILNH